MLDPVLALFLVFVLVFVAGIRIRIDCDYGAWNPFQKKSSRQERDADSSDNETGET